MKLIKDLGMVYATPTSKTKRRQGLYECPTCKKHFAVDTTSVKSGKSSKCKSCCKKKHGLGKTKLYLIWSSFKQRCFNKKDKAYKNYGGRGISVSSVWKNDFIAFRDWSMSNGYHEGLTLDRKDNDKNYSPENCRWVTMKIQACNTRKIRSSNSSGFRGVGYFKRDKKWRAIIQVNYKLKHIGYYENKIDAAHAYDKYIVDNNLEHTKNFE